MKRFLLFLIALVSCGLTAANAQSKIGHISSEAIMKELPDAQDAQRQLDALVVEWQNELQKMQQDWQNRFEEYDKRKLVMTDQRRAEAEKELQDLERRIAEYRNLKFGQNGDLFNKQNELMKPVQDRVFQAIQDVAKEEEYDYVFDKSGEILLMFANEKNDLTAKVLAKLQISVPAAPKN
ncbi:MAG: OmpH family outer membrane protein [Ignavibacteriae bacterium]|nr:OmpH family outer membrane protein [Ignavibacteriota bacterium]